MRLPPKDPKERDLEGRLPLADVLEVMRRHHVSVETEDPTLDGRVCCTLVDDTVAEAVFLPDPVGGLMVSTLARKFAIPLVEFYYFRQLDAEARQTPLH